MKSNVTVRGVSFILPNGRELFKNLNFTLASHRTALVGPNGVGKSSLARLLSREIEATEGRITSSTTLTLFSQREEPRAITVDEYLGDSTAWSPLRERLLRRIDVQASCRDLSGGQWMRVRLARVLNEGFLILDEPTNDLDREGRDALLAFLRNHDRGLLLISHDRECLEVCDEVLELSRQGLTKFGGGWSDYLTARENERRQRDHALTVSKRDRDKAAADRVLLRDRQEKRNRRGAETAARGGIPKILLGARKRRAEATSGRIDEATLERANDAVRSAHDALAELKIDPVMYADLLGTSVAPGKLVAEARGFNIRFDDWLYPEDLDFAWRGSIRLALKGSNGSGKTTLLEALRGETFVTRGELRRGALTTLYIDQRCAHLRDDKTVFENIRDVSSLSESEIRNGLARFLFVKDSVFQKVGDLSGGERLRAALARGFLAVEKPELLILDEPTNNLDLANVEFLENLARSFNGAMVVISHDEVFLKNCEIDQEFQIGK